MQVSYDSLLIASCVFFVRISIHRIWLFKVFTIRITSFKFLSYQNSHELQLYTKYSVFTRTTALKMDLLGAWSSCEIVLGDSSPIHQNGKDEDDDLIKHSRNDCEKTSSDVIVDYNIIVSNYAYAYAIQIDNNGCILKRLQTDLCLLRI